MTCVVFVCYVGLLVGSGNQSYNLRGIPTEALDPFGSTGRINSSSIDSSFVHSM